MDDHRYSYRGFEFGEGTDVLVSEVDGLSGYESRAGDTDLPRNHGGVAAPQYVVPKQIMLRFWIDTDVEASMAALRDVFAVRGDGESADLVFARPGMPERLIRCRPEAIARTETPENAQLAQPAVVLKAHDPRFYAAVEQSVSVPLYTPGGGAINYPVNYPKNFAAGIAAQAVATNDGSADAYPLVRFFGPTVGTVTGVLLQNLTTGEDLEISATITSGQVLYFDGTAFVTANGEQVVHLDGASRYGDWEQPRVPFRLQPGDNVLRFTLTGTSTDADCVVTWRSTWLH